MSISKYVRLQNLFRVLEMFIFSVLISSQLPLAVNVSADYFRGITFPALGPKCMFLITNLIILLLLFKTRVAENRDGNDLGYEYVKSFDTSVINYTTVTCLNVVVAGNKRKICRSKSENPINRNCMGSRILRRSVTTELSRSKNGGGDKLSCEEFRQTVEAFIAKQQKMLRDEEFSPMVYIGS